MNRQGNPAPCFARFALLLSCVTVLLLPSASAQKAKIDALVRALDSTNDQERAAAVDQLARQPRRVAEELFRELYAKNASLRTKTGVIEVLGKMKKTGVEVLEEQMLSTMHELSIVDHMELYRAIKELGPRAAWTSDTLVKRIEKRLDRTFPDANRMLICCALMTLGRLGPTTPRARTAARRFLADPHPHLRYSSAIAIWWMGAEATEVYAILVPGLESTSDIVALERAIYGLGELGPHAKAALPALASLRQRVPEQTKVAIADAVGKIEGRLPPEGLRPHEK